MGATDHQYDDDRKESVFTERDLDAIPEDEEQHGIDTLYINLEHLEVLENVSKSSYLY
jgi:hypothetical protein